MPQIAVEHGRKAISAADRPSVDELENATLATGNAGSAGGAEKKAA